MQILTDVQQSSLNASHFPTSVSKILGLCIMCPVARKQLEKDNFDLNLPNWKGLKAPSHLTTDLICSPVQFHCICAKEKPLRSLTTDGLQADFLI